MKTTAIRALPPARSRDPKIRLAEPWRPSNRRIAPGASVRAFSLSNWTGLDIWRYIYPEDIPVVPHCLAKEQPLVTRDERLIMVDDDRVPPQRKKQEGYF